MGAINYRIHGYASISYASGGRMEKVFDETFTCKEKKHDFLEDLHADYDVVDYEAELIYNHETTDEQMWPLFSDDQRDDAEQDEIANIVL